MANQIPSVKPVGQTLPGADPVQVPVIGVAGEVKAPDQPKAVVPVMPVGQTQSAKEATAIPAVSTPASVSNGPAISPIQPVSSVSETKQPGPAEQIPVVVKPPCSGGEAEPPLAPRILPGPGTYRTDLQPVSFESDEDFVGFYYSINGPDPNLNSDLANGPVTVTEQGAITVKAVAAGYNGLISEVTTQQYTFVFPTALAPTCNRASGSYTAPLPVTMASPEGLPVRYTLDGSDPTASSPLFTGTPLSLAAGTYVLKIRVIAPQYNPSPILTINLQVNAVNTLAMAVSQGTGGRAYITFDENLLDWTELRPMGNVDRDYSSCYASRGAGEFGRYIYLGVESGDSAIIGTYRSADYGATWSRIPSSGNSVCGSKDGQYVYTFSPGDNRYSTSTDFGQTWTARTFPPGISPWRRMACSGNGQYLFFSTFLSRNPYVSSNFGVSFTTLSAFAAQTTVPAVFNEDGSVWFTANFANAPNGLFNKWTNFGVTRTQFQLDANPVSYVYTRIACDETATKVITCRGREAAINTGRVFLNTTGGNQTGWTEVAPTGTPTDIEWTTLATNGDKYMAGSIQRLYASLNGTTWFETMPAGNVNRFWIAAELYKI